MGKIAKKKNVSKHPIKKSLKTKTKKRVSNTRLNHNASNNSPKIIRHTKMIRHKSIKLKKVIKRNLLKHRMPKNNKDDTKNDSKNDSPKKRKTFGKVIIVHGWDSDISKGWHPWLKGTLESQGFEVIMRQMPHTDAPSINEWVEALCDVSGKIDKDTYFIGHSIGCQAIIRALEKYDVKNVGGAIFIAGWFNLKDKAYTEDPKTERASRRIARPWIQNAIDFSKVQSKLPPERVVAIFSDDDPYVDMDNARIFKEKLGARIIVENGRGHYDSEDNLATLPLVVEEFLRMATGINPVDTASSADANLGQQKMPFDGTTISKDDDGKK